MVMGYHGSLGCVLDHGFSWDMVLVSRISWVLKVVFDFHVIKDSGLIWSIIYKDGRVSWEIMLPKATSG